MHAMFYIEINFDYVIVISRTCQFIDLIILQLYLYPRNDASVSQPVNLHSHLSITRNVIKRAYFPAIIVA